tara:strand:- start:3822 stop:5885 length:2064 start_codon:yes stop_codon:yes gene_type:complete
MRKEQHIRKAARLTAKAEALLDKLKADFTEDYLSQIPPHKAHDPATIKDRIHNIFDSWHEHVRPLSATSEDGSTTLFIPVGVNKRQNKNKSATKKLNLYLSYQAYVLQIGTDQTLTVTNFHHSNKKNNVAYSPAHAFEIFQTNPKKRPIPVSSFKLEDFDKLFNHHKTRTDFKTLPDYSILSQIAPLNRRFGILKYKEFSGLRRTLKKIESLHLESTAHKLASLTDSKAVHSALLNGAHADINHYNWLVKGYANNAYNDRINAFRAYPALSLIFARSTHNSRFSDSELQKAEDLIDNQGYSMPQTIQAIYGSGVNLPKKLLSPLHGVRYTVFGDNGRRFFTKNLIDALPLIPQKDFPQTPEEWERLTLRAERLKNVRNSSRIPLDKLYKQYGFDVPRNTAQGEDWYNVSDFVRDLYKKMLAPIVTEVAAESAHCDDPSNATLALMDDPQLQHKFLSMLTTSQITKGSKDWHDRLQTVRAQFNSISIPSDQTWPALVEPLTAPNGVYIEALTSKAALEKESELMDHCVHGYSSNCVLRNSHILHFSYQDAGKGPTLHGTLELKDEERGKQRIVVKQQFQAYHNHTPAPVLQEAAKWFIEQINADKLPVDWHKLEVARRQAQEEYNKNQIANRLGFDVYNPEAREEAYSIVQRFCYGAMSKLDREDFIKRADLKPAIEQKLKERGLTHV